MVAHVPRRSFTWFEVVPVKADTALSTAACALVVGPDDDDLRR